MELVKSWMPLAANSSPTAALAAGPNIAEERTPCDHRNLRVDAPLAARRWVIRASSRERQRPSHACRNDERYAVVLRFRAVEESRRR